MICTSRICGCLIFAIRLTSTRLPWKFTTLAMLGDSYVRLVLVALARSHHLKTFSGASMTLVGLLPPLCDRGNMLVDGGYSE